MAFDPRHNTFVITHYGDGEEGLATWRRVWQLTPVFLPGESLWTEEPGGLQFMRSYKVGHD